MSQGLPEERHKKINSGKGQVFRYRARASRITRSYIDQTLPLERPSQRPESMCMGGGKQTSTEIFVKVTNS